MFFSSSKRYFPVVSSLYRFGFTAFRLILILSWWEFFSWIPAIYKCPHTLQEQKHYCFVTKRSADESYRHFKYAFHVRNVRIFKMSRLAPFNIKISTNCIWLLVKYTYIVYEIELPQDQDVSWSRLESRDKTKTRPKRDWRSLMIKTFEDPRKPIKHFNKNRFF